jgi:hypothetical protein
MDALSLLQGLRLIDGFSRVAGMRYPLGGGESSFCSERCRAFSCSLMLHRLRLS